MSLFLVNDYDYNVIDDDYDDDYDDDDDNYGDGDDIVCFWPLLLLLFTVCDSTKWRMTIYK